MGGESRQQLPQAYRRFLHQHIRYMCVCVCVREREEGKCMLCVCILLFVFTCVRVLDDNTARPRRHVSPHARCTVALARGIFISLCVGLFIVSQALSQMCNFIAPLYPAAWVHMICCLFLLLPCSPPPPPPHHTCLLQRAAVSKHMKAPPHPPTPTSRRTLSCKVSG